MINNLLTSGPIHYIFHLLALILHKIVIFLSDRILLNVHYVNIIFLFLYHYFFYYFLKDKEYERGDI